MNSRRVCLLFALTVCLVNLTAVLGHAPLIPGENESLATATIIPDPAKSWAIYDSLHEGQEAHYYRFSIAQGKRIYITLLISPASRDRGFAPSFILFGPGLRSEGSAPEYVGLPKGLGFLVVEGKPAAQATYEGFSPSSFYSAAVLDLSAPMAGTHYIAVYEPKQGGEYGLAVGYEESFTLTEWILTPINLLSIYRWEGQSLPQIVAPTSVVVLIGAFVFIRKTRTRRKDTTLSVWTGLLAALSFLGTGATSLSQMVFALTTAPLGLEVSVTLVFAALPIVLGILTLRLVSGIRGEFTLSRRLRFLLIGFLAIFLWAGYLVGPMLAVATSLLPAKTSAR
jgi:hypothetical protein